MPLPLPHEHTRLVLYMQCSCHSNRTRITRSLCCTCGGTILRQPTACCCHAQISGSYLGMYDRIHACYRCLPHALLLTPSQSAAPSYLFQCLHLHALQAADMSWLTHSWGGAGCCRGMGAAKWAEGPSADRGQAQGGEGPEGAGARPQWSWQNHPPQGHLRSAHLALFRCVTVVPHRYFCKGFCFACSFAYACGLH